MEAGPYVREEVPDVADDDAEDLVLGYRAVHEQAESHQHPRQVGRFEDEQEEEGEPRFRVAARPDVHEGRGERGAEEGDRDEERADREERESGVEQQPGEVRGGDAGTGFEKS